MKITYHPQLTGHEVYFPHSCLEKTIQEYIENRGMKALCYRVHTNKYYLFIHFDSGDRIDVALD